MKALNAAPRPQSYTHLHSILKKNQLFVEIKEALWFKLGFPRVQARPAELTGGIADTGSGREGPRAWVVAVVQKRRKGCRIKVLFLL